MDVRRAQYGPGSEREGAYVESDVAVLESSQMPTTTMEGPVQWKARISSGGDLQTLAGRVSAHK